MEKKFWHGGELALSLSESNQPDIRQAVHEQIKAFNDAISEHHRQGRKEGSVRPLHIILRGREGTIWGGLIADTYWNWLDIDDFWLHESVRGRGIGRIMLQAAEEEAVARGCHYARLATFSFQARGFYEKCGYEVTGQLDEYPPGHSFYWLVKRLVG